MKPPTTGKHYIIDGIVDCGLGVGNLIVRGCHNRICGDEVGFRPDRFRPLIEESATAQLARLETERWVEGETIREPEPAY